LTAGLAHSSWLRFALQGTIPQVTSWTRVVSARMIDRRPRSRVARRLLDQGGGAASMRGFGDWRAVSVHTAVPARGWADDGGCAGPALDAPRCRGRRRRSGGGPGGADGDPMAESPERADIARLNAGLDPRLTFSVLMGRGRMVVELADGGRRAVDRPILTTRRLRHRLHAVAACFAECAMELGIGTGVYRRSPISCHKRGRVG
jgi:hypothetical protein